MKRMVALVVLVLVAGVTLAQERIAPEDAQKYARLFVQTAGKVANLPLQVQPDADKPFGLKKDDVGVMVIPAQKLTEEALRKAGKDVTPLGQLWVRNLTLVVKDQPLPNDRLLPIKVTINEQEHSLPLFLLGVRKKGEDALEVLVYTKEKEPVLVVPLRKVENKQELPIELAGKAENDRGVLTLNILGKYQAQLTLAKQEQ